MRAASRLGLPLRIIGRGPDEARLRRLAGPGVAFLGRVSDAERVGLLQRCAAVIVAGREDFGMVALEAQAAGRPVLAYGAGGSLETVVPGGTGAFFEEPTAESLEAALQRFDPAAYDPETCRANARRFDVESFKRRMHAHIATLMQQHQAQLQEGSPSR